MKRIGVHEAQPGQVVVQAVFGSAGLALLRPGSVLTADMISRLSNYGVATLSIEDDGAEVRPIEERLRDLDARFAGHEQDTLMRRLKEVIAAQMREGAGSGA
jgi:hypothetical protein